MFQLYCALIIVFTSSYSQAQNGFDGLEGDNSQTSYFFYQREEYPRDCKDVYIGCPASNFSGVFLIKPNGYPAPFEVYCSNDNHLGEWTVIQRRVDGSVDFNRDWQEYKNGFGFLSTEFWFGNEKLSYLTNQALYELRIDIELSNGTSLFTSYGAFRISDEWSHYSLVSVGDAHGNIALSCPPNMIFGNCSCQPSCDDPSGVNSCNDNCDGKAEACVCASGFLMKDGKCVLRSVCGCFVTETNSVVPAGKTHVNAECSEKCTCGNGALQCNSSYGCSSNAACTIQADVQGCYCNEGYEGDGEACTALYTDCYDAYQAGRRQDGVYAIHPVGWPGSPFNVSCDMTTAGGGWTRRTDGVTDFYRYWEDYKHGFGSVEQGNDFWLGNEQLYYLTKQKTYSFRADVGYSGGSSYYGEYASFRIDDESNKYRLSISGHSGGGVGMDYTDGRMFSTRDQDNDEVCGSYHCAQKQRGGWWYGFSDWCSYCHGNYCANFHGQGSCHCRCTFSNLNGDYDGGNGEHIFWRYHHSYNNDYCNLNLSEMKIRPVN